MATWRGEVTTVAVEKRGGLRVRWWLVVRIGIIESGNLQDVFTCRLPYPASELAGLSLEEKWEKILNEGAGSTPSLRQVGADLLEDWAAGAVLRQLPANHEFGPR